MEQVKLDIMNFVSQLGCYVVQVNFLRKKTLSIQVFIEKTQYHAADIEMCSYVSNKLLAYLNMIGALDTKFNLEVSSPGLERPLLHIEDYQYYVGKLVNVKLYKAVNDIYTIKGTIINIDNSDIILMMNNIEHIVNIENIRSAKLMITDDMIKNLLSKKNK